MRRLLWEKGSSPNFSFPKGFLFCFLKHFFDRFATFGLSYYYILS